MKKIILIAVFQMITMFCISQNWVWAQNTLGQNTNQVSAVCNDASGNIFVAGYSQGPSVSFGSFILNNTYTMGVAAYLTKYDVLGNVMWAQNFGGNPGIDVIRDACTDAAGNVFVTGALGGTAVTIGTITLNGPTGADIFVAKFDNSGNALWAQRFGGIWTDEGMGLCVDNTGNVCIAGYFDSPSLVIGSTTLSCNGFEGSFLAKFDTNGNLLWATKPTGSGADKSYDIKNDATGNLFLAGQFGSASLNFGSFSVSKTGNQNAYVAKYDPNGNALWAKNTVGTATEYFMDLSVDPSGDAYVLGYFTSSVVTIGSHTLSNMAQEDVMIAKYDASGNVAWAKRAASFGRDIGHAIKVFNNSVYFSGSMGSFAYAGASPVTIGTTVVQPPSGSTDPLFFAQLDLNGNVQSAVGFASGGYNHSSISFDNICHLYLGGNYHNMNQQPMLIGTNTLNYSVYTNVFLARMDVSCETVGLEDRAYPENVLVYPNPANGLLRVDLQQNTGPHQLIVYDLTGRPVIIQKLDGLTNDIELPSLLPGIYEYVVFKNGSRWRSGKLVIQ
jgi:hypothetical protein